MTTQKNTESVEKNPLFRFGPPPIQTAEDAREQYLRGFISEDDLKAALAKFGHSDGTALWYAPSNLERPDDAFENKLPDEFFQQPGSAVLSVEDRIKLADDKAAIRDAATKASEKVTSKVEPETSLGEAQNRAADKAAEKPEQKLDKDLSAANDAALKDRR